MNKTNDGTNNTEGRGGKNHGRNDDQQKSKW